MSFFFQGESGGSGQDTSSQCSTRIEEEDAELGIIEDDLNTTAQAVSIVLLIIVQLNLLQILNVSFISSNSLLNNDTIR